MKIPFWKPDSQGLDQLSPEELSKNYGQRSIALGKLMAMSSTLGFSVPEFLVIPVTFADKINEQYGEVADGKEISSYLSLEEGRVDLYQRLIKEYLTDLQELARMITSSNPIIRGSSSLEGVNSLSFAGVCKTVIPHKDVSSESHLKTGVAKVLAGSFTPYANYYMTHHEVKKWGRNVGVTLMKLVAHPIIHATAYAYPDELRIRYFLNPTVGTKYAGGHEMILRREGSTSSQLPEHAQDFQKTWEHVAKTMWALHDVFYGEPVPIDVEFLVEDSGGKQVLQIVQMRPISRPHEKNYLQAKVLSRVEQQRLESKLIIPHSVYEDRRLNMVIHCNENVVHEVSHGDKIMLQSNGNEALIQVKGKK